MPRKNSEFVKAMGTSFQIIKVLAEAIHARGGSDDDLRRVLSDEALADEVAKLIVGKREATGIERKFLFLPFVPTGKMHKGKSCVSGDELISLCGSLAGREATQEDGEYLLTNLHLIPAEYQREKNLVIAGWRRSVDSHSVAYLSWRDGQWMLFWYSLASDFHGDDLVVRVVEE